MENILVTSTGGPVFPLVLQMLRGVTYTQLQIITTDLQPTRVFCQVLTTANWCHGGTL